MEVTGKPGLCGHGVIRDVIRGVSACWSTGSPLLPPFRWRWSLIGGPCGGVRGLAIAPERQLHGSCVVAKERVAFS